MEIRLNRPLPGNVAALRLNKTLHGRSVHRPADVDGHNVVHNYFRPGHGDAVDLFVAAGTEVYAMHPGRVTRRDAESSKVDVVQVEGKVRGHSLLTVYAHLHIKDAVEMGDSVSAGQVIGYVGRELRDPHLHLEVFVDGQPVHGKTADEFVDKLASILG